MGTGLASSRYKHLVDLIDKERIVKALDSLAKISDPAFGSVGITRLAFSETDIKGKEYVAQLMIDAGLDVRVCPVGNTFGRLKGDKSDDLAILSGSHTDSVINGGHFDGIVGVICAIEALRVLQTVKDELVHPIEVIDFVMEESSRFGVALFGSKVFMGNQIDDSTLQLKDNQGVTLAEALHQVQSRKYYKGAKSKTRGLVEARAAVEQARTEVEKIRAYVELHVEQAGFLEEANIPIGIVNGAAMPTRWSIDIIGEQAHSGATPMDRRKNALVAASEFVLLVDRLAKEEAEHGTVGAITKMTVEPNAINTVPGKCNMFLDLRSADKESKDRVKSRLLDGLNEICVRHQVSHTRKVLSEDDPKTFSPKIIAISEKICQSMDVPYMVLPSRAGHDACTVSNKVSQVGMIFVPSKGGVSHHHEEWTEIDDIVLGTKILMLTLFELATTA